MRQVNVHKLPVQSRQLVDTVEAGSLEALLIDDLKVDPIYQRDVSADLVQKMAAEWDMTVAGTITVSRRGNGELYVIDGQHRLVAAKLHGETHILAQVLTGLGRQTEAEMRLRGNVRRGDKAQERFRAQLAAKNPESLAIVKLCEEYETMVNASPNAEHGINSVSALEELYRLDRGILLSRTFDVVSKTFGQIGGRNATVNVLKGTAWFIHVHAGEMELARYIERIGLEGVEGMDRKARAMAASMSGSLWLNWYRAAVAVYNERLPEGAKLEWKTGGWSKYKTGSYGGM